MAVVGTSDDELYSKDFDLWEESFGEMESSRNRNGRRSTRRSIEDLMEEKRLRSQLEDVFDDDEF